MRSVILGAAALVIMGFATSPTVAGGLYLGAGFGSTFFNSEVKDALDQIKTIDENATAWKIFGGFRGARFIGVEGGYRDFGKISSTVSSQF